MKYERPEVVSLSVEEIVEGLGPACALGSGTGGGSNGTEIETQGLVGPSCSPSKRH